MHHLSIRETNSQDSSSLRSLMHQLGYMISSQEMEKNIALFSSPEKKVWIAEQEGELVGCMAVILIDNFHQKSSFLRVLTVIVDQHHRRKGIGKKLLQTAEKYALQINCSHMELSSGIHRKNLGAYDFYRSMGFEEQKEKTYFIKKLHLL